MSWPPRASAQKTLPPNLKVMFWGDSGMQYAGHWASAPTPGIATQTNGVATWFFANHGAYVGEPVTVVNVEDPYWYGAHKISAIIDANNVQFLVDPRAAADAYSVRAPGTLPHVTFTHKVGRANPFIAALCQAGIVPSEMVNLAANSQTAKSMGWHIERDLADYPDFDLWVCATVGANDVRVEGTTGNLKQALDEAKARMIRLKQAGKTVLYYAWMPNDVRDASRNRPCYMADGVTLFNPATNTVAKATERFNAEMKSWCALNGIDILSQYDMLVDPLDANGYAFGTGTTAVLISDGVHVGKRGARMEAPSGAAWLKAKYPAYGTLLSLSQLNRKRDTANAIVNPVSQQIFRNPLLVTVSGTPGLAADVSATAQFGMPAATSVALVPRTVVADGDAIGFNQQVTWLTTGTGAGQGGALSFVIPNADIVLGGKLQGACTVKTAGQTNFIGARLYISVTTSNYGIIVGEMGAGGSGTDNVEFDNTDVLNEMFFTPAVFIPIDAVIVSAVMICQGFVKALAGAGTSGFMMECGRIAVWATAK